MNVEMENITAFQIFSSFLPLSGFIFSSFPKPYHLHIHILTDNALIYFIDLNYCNAKFQSI